MFHLWPYVKNSNNHEVIKMQDYDIIEISEENNIGE